MNTCFGRRWLARDERLQWKAVGERKLEKGRCGKGRWSWEEVAVVRQHPVAGTVAEIRRGGWGTCSVLKALAE